jgi:membrane fusion protein, multidrug efflux system
MASEAHGNPSETQPPAAVPPAPRVGLMERKPHLRILVRVVVVLLFAGAIFYWWNSRKYEETDDAQVDGYIDPISARVNGHVVKVMVQDGQYVKAGTELAEIDDRDYEVAVERARGDYMNAVAASQAVQYNVPITQVGSSSQIHSARADMLSAEAGIAAANKQVEAAQARLVEAEANARTANLDEGRYRLLVVKKEISRQLYDQSVAAATSANATVTAATAAVHSAQEAVKQAQARMVQARAEMANARITPKQIAATQARVRASEAKAAMAKAALDQAELNLGYTRVYAPVDGVVGNRSVQVGQNVQAGQQMLSLVPRKDVWVTANFKETQLQHMHAGQMVEISVDAMGGKTFKGTVTAIGGATGSRFSLLPPENATGNYVKVVQRVPVRIDFNDREQSNFNQGGRLRPGLSVQPSVRVR